MWGSFFVAAVTAALFLYVPGYLVLRGLRVGRLFAFACAPIVGIVACNILCIAYSKAGIACSWELLVVPTLVAGLLLWAVAVMFARGKAPLLDAPAYREGSVADRVRGFDWLVLALYVGMGVVLALYVLVGSLDGPDSFVQEYDNVHHLGVIHGFVSSGDWSALNVGLYPGDDVAFNPLYAAGGYYPTAWHCLAAFVVSLFGVSASLAANAVNFCFVAVVMPSSAYLLMRVLFSETPGVIVAGSLCVLAFSASPWWLLVFGPLYPNAASFSLVPSAAVCFLSVFAKGVSGASRAFAGALFCVCIVCFVFTQPVSVFTLGVFLAPFCVRQAVLAADLVSVRDDRRPLVKVGLALAAVAAIAAVWFALYKAPFLQGLVTHSWPAYAGKLQALADVLFLAFRASTVQVVLAALVIAGALWTLRHRRYLWLSCSYAFACLVYFTCVSVDLPVRFLLAGFWYTDSYRIAAFAAMFAVPLASIGLWLAARGLARVLSAAPVRLKGRAASTAAAAAVAVAFVCANYCPSYVLAKGASATTAFGAVADALASGNSASSPRVYDADEEAFVEEAKQKLPEGALLLNEPDDGSAFAYGVNGLNIYYRYLRTYGGVVEPETEESALIRTGLYRVASDERVREAVRSVGSEYLLLLDQGEPQSPRRYLFTYEDGRLWKGLESIDDDTPGFEIVLKRGDMRLYRITAV